MKLSIVIPAFNGGKTIKKAVESALGQQFYDATGMQSLFEVIVRDDGSTDNTLEVLSGIDDKRLNVVAGEHCGSIAKSFQAAFDLATGYHVTILGQDDEIDSNYAERVLAEFKDGIAMVAVHPRFVDEAGNPYNNPGDPRLQIPKPVNRTRAQWLELFRIVNNYFGINTYKREAVIEAGGFDEKAGWLLDWDLYTRLVKAHDIHVIEEELCSLGLSANSTSFITTDKIPLQHQYNRYIRQKNFTPTKRKIAFATPFYMSQGFAVHSESMIATTNMLTLAGIEWELIWPKGDSYVDRAKNTIAANFLESDCTELIMIDSDEQWHPEAVSRLLQHPEEIVAAAYPFKNRWDQFAGNPDIEIVNGAAQYAEYRSLSDGAFVLRAYNISGGFVRIKRSALEKYADAYPNDIYIDDCAWPGRPGRIYTAFFMCDIVNYYRYGEDAFFSRRMKEIGVKLWIDTNISITHYGVHGWTGNLHQKLLKSPAELEAISAQLIADAKAQEEINRMQAEES